MPPTAQDAVDEVLASAEQVYVGVGTRSGPHVTPELFTSVGGRIVCLTAASTLKVRRLRNHPEVAVAAGGPGHALTLVGRAVIVDPAAPGTILRSPVRAAAAPLAAARFALANVAELAGAATDLFAGRLGGPIPPHRVLLAIEPAAVAVTHLDAITDHWGWTDLAPHDDSADRPADDDVDPRTDEDGEDLDAGEPDLDPLPEELAALADSESAVVGWTREDGAPLALLARWDGGRGRAMLPDGLLDLVGAARRSPACATFDAWTGFGPSGKQGVMLRGTGEVLDDGAGVDCRFDRATHWDGVATETTDLTETTELPDLPA